jgi:hypothetical protein
VTDDLHTQVRKVMAAVHFVVLSTAEDAVPSPVFCAFDVRPAVYWGSSRECAHSQYVERTGRCTYVFVNTTAKPRAYRGFYAEASVRLLTEPHEMDVALTLIMARRTALGDEDYWDLADFKGGKIGLYEAVPLKAWVNKEVRDADGTVHDRRIPVPLPLL